MYIRRMLIYTRRHLDFLILDLVTYWLAYCVAVEFRRHLDIRIYRGDLFLKCGLAGLLIYFIVEYASQNLNGILSRNIPREAEAVGTQMVMSWSVFTVFLYLMWDAHDYSRAVYLTAFITCSISILFTRTVWKYVARYTRLHNRVAPELLVICDAPRAQKTLSRILRGSFENKYEIIGVVTNGSGELDYNDFYPHREGLEHIQDFLADKRVQEAYVELSDAGEEKTVIHLLLQAGVIVHRSLGDSQLHYASQRIGEVGSRSVITIDGGRITLVSHMDRLFEQHRKKTAEKNDDANV